MSQTSLRWIRILLWCGCAVQGVWAKVCLGQATYAPLPISDMFSATPDATAPFNLQSFGSEVSSNGAYQRSFPIDVPPYHGLEPRLALTYNSLARGDGIAGPGWSLSGWSVIERTNPRKGAPGYGLGGIFQGNASNVYVYPPALEADIYLLDGMELVPCTTLGGTHCTKIQSNQRITFDGVNWYVWRKDGTKLTYSKAYTVSPGPDGVWNTSDDIAWTWALRSVVDTHGNSVTYNWNMNRFGYCGLHPDSISYNSVTVMLLCEARHDPYNRASGIGPIVVPGRLKTIDVTANGARIRAYGLNYGPLPLPVPSLLASIQQFGSDAVVDTRDGSATRNSVIGGSSLPSITFAYADQDALSFSVSRPASAPLDPGTVVGDFNGDGKSDLFNVYTGYLWLSNGDGTFTVHATSGYKGAWPQCGSNASTCTFHVTGDFDGDGRMDILNWTSNGSVSLFLNRGAGTFQEVPSPAGLFLDNYGLDRSFTPGQMLMLAADLDGDGRTDIFVVGAYGGCKALYSKGDGTFSGMVWQAFTPGWVTGHVVYLVTDIDGDGRMEVLSWRDDGYAQITAKDALRLNSAVISLPKWFQGTVHLVGDFNGDGKTDILMSQPDGVTQLLQANGNNTFDIFLPGGIGGPWPLGQTTHVLGDFNGDGKTDILRWRTDGNNHLFLSNGNGGFYDKYQPLGIGAMGWQPSGQALTGDFNGDGKTDIYFVTTSPQATYLFQWAYSGVPEYALTRWTNGLGGTTSISYAPSWVVGSMLPGPPCSASNNPPLTWAASQITTDDGNGVSATEQGLYAGPYFNRAAREFRGFNCVRATGPRGPNGEFSDTQLWFHQGDDVAVDANDPSARAGYMVGRVYRKRAWNTPTDTIDTFIESLISYWPASGPPYFAPPASVTNRSCSYNDGTVTCGASSTTTYADFDSVGNQVFPYDAYGNLLRENRYVDSLVPGYDQTIIRTYTSDASKYIVGLKTSETVYPGAGSPTPLGPANRVAQARYDYDGITGTDCVSYAPGTAITSGHLTRMSRWLNGGTDPETWIRYDGAGNVLCVSDPDRRVTKYGYDASSTFRTSVTNAKQHTGTTKYYGVDGEPVDKGRYGQVERMIDPNLVETIFEYDVFGRKTNERIPAVPPPANVPPSLAPPAFAGFTAATTYSLGAGGNYVETTGPDGSSRTYFDGLGRTFLTKTQAPAAATSSGASMLGRVIATRRQFNPTGTVSQQSLPYEDTSVPMLRWTSFSYDGRGRGVRASGPDGARTLRCYNDLDRSVVTVDGNNHALRKASDVRGNTITAQEYRETYTSCPVVLGAPYATTTYTHDVMSRLHVVTDARGTHFQADYDTLGRKMSLSDPDLGNWIYHYSAAGDLTSQQDGRGVVVGYDPDELHRLSVKRYPDGTTVSYTYDDDTVPYSKGRLTGIGAGSQLTAYGYDAVGRPWKSARLVDGTWYTFLSSYDTAGRLSGITYPDGHVISYAYDADGFLSAVSDGSTVHASLAGYNILGQPHLLTFGNQAQTQYSYNDATNSTLRSIVTTVPGGSAQGTSTLLNLAFEYDGLLNVTGITDALNPVLTQHFMYDELGRLTGESSSYRAGSGLIYTYGDPVRVHAVAHTSDGRSYQYDGNGNLVTDGVRTIAYDFDNRMACMRVGGTQALNYPTCAVAPDGTTTVFGYSGDGERVKKQGPSGSTVYVGKLYECTGGTCTRHVFAGELRIASISSDGAVKYYHTDHLGSTRGVTGSASEALSYRPFGASQSDSAPSVTKFKFTSQELDPDSGLYVFPARAYDATLGRFTSPDSIVPDLEDPQTLNRYSYARNNPVRFIDPSGHRTECFLFLCIWYPDDDGGWWSSGGGSVAQDPAYNPLPPGYPNPYPGGDSRVPGGRQSPAYTPPPRPPPPILGTGSIGGLSSGSLASSSLGLGTNGYYDAGLMFLGWLYGVGPSKLTFGPETIEVRNLQTSPGVNEARRQFYDLNLGVRAADRQEVRFPYHFGLKGLANSGFNPTAQFVGSYVVRVHPMLDGKQLYTVENITSFTSFFYGLGPDWERSSFKPMGNVRQLFYWVEPDDLRPVSY